MKKVIIGISGSSAPILGVRILEVLAKNSEVETHLVLSETVEKTLSIEAAAYSVPRLKELASFSYGVKDMAASIASGSFLTDGMVVIPCSMRTLSAIAHAQSDNLLTRAADVTLKERRPLILVTRETPLNLAHLRNMVQVTEMGGVILPPNVAFYHQPKSPMDLVDHTVGKVLDVLKIPHELFRRWQGAPRS
jgi:4-hydroxy-3-polyprenylbenzoate decarboxylase